MVRFPDLRLYEQVSEGNLRRMTFGKGIEGRRKEVPEGYRLTDDWVVERVTVTSEPEVHEWKEGVNTSDTSTEA